MAFTSYLDPQVRLRFSQTADEVIKSDKLIFQEDSDSRFVNRIIENYYATALASIGLRLDEYQEKLLEIKQFQSRSKDKNELLNELCKRKENELYLQAIQYEAEPKGDVRPPYRLRNKLFYYLTEEDSICKEDLYYKNLSQYLRAIVEEYARLPYVKRELIYYQETASILQEALSLKKQIKITTSTQQCFHVLPYALVTDPLGTANYLAAFSYGIDSDKSEMKPCSFRISAIQKVQLEKSKSGYLHPQERNLMEDTIQKRGVQFLLSEDDTISVRLTEKGVEMYHRQIHLRPSAPKIEGDIYTFSCSLSQAEFYFFKFGAEAEIISPPELVEIFRNKYEKAYKLYQQ